jgi:hypothetical protein
MFQKRLGYSIKKRRKREREKKERTNAPLINKERFNSPSSPQSLQVSKRGI